MAYSSRLLRCDFDSEPNSERRSIALKNPIFKLVFVFSLTLAFIATDPAFAQRRNGFLGGLFNGGQQNREQQAAAAAQRRANATVQTALNYFGFNVGTVDGILGQKSREAISAYQTFLDIPVSGRLSSDDRAFLLSAYEQISNAEDEVKLQISLNLVTVQDLLKVLYQGEPLVEEPPEVVATVGPRSMRTLCVNIQAAGPLDLVKGQYCNLRQLAVEQGDFLLETALHAQSLEPIAGECQRLTLDLKPQFEQILTDSGEPLIEIMMAWNESADIPHDKLVRLSETCLGVAYQHDDSEAALAALMVLSGLERSIYIEMLGYHAAFGLGFEGVSDFAHAATWLEAALSRLPEEGVGLTAQSGVLRAKIIVDVLSILLANR